MKIKFFMMLAVCVVSVAMPAGAQQQTTQLQTQTESQGFLGNAKVIGGIKSYNSLGRMYELERTDGRRFKSKNEFYVGFKNSQDWGAYVQGVTSGTSYGDTAKKPSSFGLGDPSISFPHPIYKSDDWKITGQFRQYVPVSESSINKRTVQHAYYLTSTTRLGNMDFFNQLIPRYYSQPSYARGDTTFYTEDWTTVSRSLTSWLKVGGGQHFQMEVHPVTQTGVCLEVFPYADFNLTPTTFISTRLYMPVLAEGSVYEGPVSASANNFQFELYFQSTL